MCDICTGTLTLLKADYKNPKVKKALKYVSEYNIASQGKSKWETKFDTVSYDGSLVELRHGVEEGTFPKIEEALVEMGVPFDRHSDGHYEILPFLRSFRPARDGREAYNREIVLTNDDNAFVEIDELREIMGKDIPDSEKLALIKEHLDDYDRCPYPLEDEQPYKGC
jgi:hypothetical protein